jgi:hypothetical protein
MQAAGAAAGTFFGACQIAWFPDPLPSAKGITVVGRTAASAVAGSLLRPATYMSLAAASFCFVECMSESMRNKKDSWNSVLGGFAAGMVMGSVTKRFDIMTSMALGTGLVMGTTDFIGPSTVVFPVEKKERDFGVLPKTHVESEALAGLKEKYPKFKDL